MLFLLMKALLHFYQKRTKSSLLISAIELVGEKNLQTISGRLVEWIKVEGMRKKTRNLVLRSGIPWCESLKLLIEQNLAFSQSFKVIKNDLTYNDAIIEKERLKTIEYITENFHTPLPLITYYRSQNDQNI